MSNELKNTTILVADDDPDDRLLIREALDESSLGASVAFVEDGEELLDYLKHQGQYATSRPPRPGIILLDLNMPRKDGFEALQELKSDPELRMIPIIVLTTSKAEEDIALSYSLGGSSFVSKPVNFESLMDVMKTLAEYWFQIVKLPTTR